jgi:hypothetical protein
MHKYLDQAITLARHAGARWRVRGADDSLIARYRAPDAQAVFTIVGSGGTVNDLSEADMQEIERGTSACINMAGVAPIAFDIYSIEAISDAHQSDSLAAKVAAQGKPAIFWFQNRSKHDSPHIRALTGRFPTHSYTRVSVSVRKRLESYRHVFRTVMRRRVFETPDLNVNFALTGSVARLVLLACALGYRRIRFVGIDLGSTRYFWQEGVALRGVAPWQDVNGAFNPRPDASSFQGRGGLVVPTLQDFLRSLHEDAPVRLEFSTLDPAGRSLLTTFLRDELHGGAGHGVSRANSL